MASLNQAEIDALTCNLCDEVADVVVQRADGAGLVSLCEECLREMLDGVTAHRKVEASH